MTIWWKLKKKEKRIASWKARQAQYPERDFYHYAYYSPDKTEEASAAAVVAPRENIEKDNVFLGSRGVALQEADTAAAVAPVEIANKQESYGRDGALRQEGKRGDESYGQDSAEAKESLPEPLPHGRRKLGEAFYTVANAGSNTGGGCIAITGDDTFDMNSDSCDNSLKCPTCFLLKNGASAQAALEIAKCSTARYSQTATMGTTHVAEYTFINYDDDQDLLIKSTASAGGSSTATYYLPARHSVIAHCYGDGGNILHFPSDPHSGRVSATVTASGGNAATLNAQQGLITSETDDLGNRVMETITLTNNRVLAGSRVLAQAYTCTGGQISMLGVTVSSGSIAFATKNLHQSTACSSTYKISFIVM